MVITVLFLKLPQDPQPWSGILNTKKNTVVCYQDVVKYKNLNISEDCLYINVYTPVVSWIYFSNYFKHMQLLVKMN